ncbi:MAG: alpha/beta hydrolase family protein [Halarsenatibacteraceae bacterium]
MEFNKLLDNLQVTEIEIAGIPCIEIVPPEIKGDIIFYHGWSSRKENQVFRGKILASHGYRVLLPDAPYHGQRNRLDFNAGKGEELLADYFFETLIRAILESAELIDYLGREKPITTAGHSMGGFIAAGVFTAKPDISRLININGSSAWLKTRDIWLDELDFNQPIRDKINIDGKRYHLRDYDPYSNLDKIQNRPILILHGESDSSVQIEAQKEYYQAAKEIYEDQERIRLVTYENLNHYIIDKMLEEIINWL